MRKESIYVCANCKYANHYAAYWWYPYLDPQCSITKLTITPQTKACKNFELKGRLSR